MRRSIPIFLAILLGPAIALAESIDGSVTYLQRIALPPEAVLEVVLEDVSRADAAAVEIASLRIEAPGAPPYAFSLDYDPAAIDPRHLYSLRARITHDGALLMTTDTAYPVLTQAAGNEAEMVLRMVDAKPDSDLTNTYWKLVSLGGEEVQAVEDRREPHMILRSDGSYNATVGCNQIRGGYERDEASLRFLPGAMTMMACPPPLDALERGLTEMLGAVASFEIAGESMALLDGSGTRLAEFRAIYF